jgi:hypothetical protein
VESTSTPAYPAPTEHDSGSGLDID